MAPSPQTSRTSPDDQPLGDYLRKARQALGLTLREVEARTNKAVTNGYLSQIEKKTIHRPSPNILFNLASAYGLDYGDLLERAGHHVPADRGRRGRKSESTVDRLVGIPMRALEELTDEERREVTEYIAFLRQKRERRSSDS